MRPLFSAASVATSLHLKDDPSTLRSGPFEKAGLSYSSESSRLLPFPVLAKRRRFEQIRTLLLDPNVNHDSWLKLGIQKRGTTALHVILEHSPPLDIVILVIERLSSKPNFLVPEQARDSQNQTPLHVAVRNGCDISVVARLLKGITGSFPASIQDNLGHVPLHIACFHKRADGKAEESAKIIKLLLTFYPLSATILDYAGYTPLDYAKKMVQTHEWNVKDMKKAGARCNCSMNPGGKNRMPILRVTRPLVLDAEAPKEKKKEGNNDASDMKEEEKKEEEPVPTQLACHDPVEGDDNSSVVSDLTNPT